MPPKRSAAGASSSPATPKPSNTSAPSTQSSTSKSSSSAPSSTSLSSKSSAQDIALHVWNNYVKNTHPRIKLLDTFMAFLVAIGGVQFVYAVVGGNYPFNAFLSGFCAAVGQFVLTASLRMQTSSPADTAALSSTSSLVSPANKTSASNKEKADGEVIEDLGQGGKGYSHERAFADYVFGSLILHLFCVNFIN